MINIEDIPNMPNQDDRIEEITMDCYDEYEELAGFYTYFEDALKCPFDAIWDSEDCVVLDVADYDEQRGILLHVKKSKKDQRVIADEIWAKDKDSTNAIVLNDYRYWINRLGGLGHYDDYY